MLLWLLDHVSPLETTAILASLAKITLRAALAGLGSFLLAVVLGPIWIRWLQRRFREPIRSDSAELNRLHADKRRTPTMGGLFVVAAVAGAVLVLGHVANPMIVAAVVVLLGLGSLGAVDDLIKLRTRRNGMSARSKLAGQIAVAAVAAVILFEHHTSVPDGLAVHVPVVGSVSLLDWTGGSTSATGWVFLPLAIVVIVGCSNAVNLTDGLDGLAGGCAIFALAAMTGVAYASGHAEWAAYLGLPRIPGAGELTIVGAAGIGALLGFLWFNCHPAQVFLGDTGALPLGGLIGVIAIAARQELLLLLVGGVFVAEALSVILQVSSYKLRRRRIFRCAPLHHHFQLAGTAENKIVTRFWIVAALCAVVGLATLKAGATVTPHSPELKPTHGHAWERIAGPTDAIGGLKPAISSPRMAERGNRTQ